MRNSMKVAKWEIKRNLTNKSFIISLILTPLIFLFFFSLPILLDSFDSDPDPLSVHVTDELGVWPEAEFLITENHPDWTIHMHNGDTESVIQIVHEEENTVYLPLTEAALTSGEIPVYLSDDLDDSTVFEFRAIENVLRERQLQLLGLSDEEIVLASQGVQFEPVAADAESEPTSEAGEEALDAESDIFAKLVPGVFAGMVLFSVAITGMMIFQSASLEKKEKVAEMLLSSITPNDLMQGKIIGYFVLGLVQVSVWFLFAIPIVQWRFDIPVFEYLLTAELLILLFYAIAGYLLFAAIFVGIGATVEDASSAGNFQGMVFVIPWMPFILMGPVLANPDGTIAQIGSYFPLTTPGIMILRLSLLDEWPWMEVLISAIALLVGIWLLMKLAGKIFKTGILLYGKNATPLEIWKWIRY